MHNMYINQIEKAGEQILKRRHQIAVLQEQIDRFEEQKILYADLTARLQQTIGVFPEEATRIAGSSNTNVRAIEGRTHKNNFL